MEKNDMASLLPTGEAAVLFLQIVVESRQKI